MNKLSYFRFGSVPRLFAGIWLVLGLMMMLSVNSYAQGTPGTFTVVLELMGDTPPSPLPIFDVTIDGVVVLTAPGSETVTAAAGGQTFVVGQASSPGPGWSARVACTATAGTQAPVPTGGLGVPVADSEVVTCTVTNEYTAPAPTEVPTPVPSTTVDPTIAEIAVNGGFSTLVAALNAAELTDIFADPDAGPFTVFAPTNDAFDALPTGTLDALLVNPSGTLTDILNYHVISGAFTASDLEGFSAGLTTLLGRDIEVSAVDGSVTLTFINDGVALVIAQDIVASNGIVHVIDTVLIPPPSTPEPTVEPTVEPTTQPPTTVVLPDPEADDDNDGLLNGFEDANNDGDPTNDDADGDGIPNYLDPDSNNNNIPDGEEFDKDGDGIGDDADGDGVPDYLDPDPVDTNGNGISDGEEFDKDGDGIVDDADGDGIPDYLDSDPVDTNGNGVSDGDEYDKNGDGIVDDADGDGIPDYLDSDPVDTNGNGISDGDEYDANGDGIVDDFDGDGIPDWLDDFVPIPSISVLKAVQTSQEVASGALGTLMLPSLTAGETLVFIIGVENTGNVPLTDVNVTDILLGADSTDCENTFPATLDVGEKLTCVVTYTITNDDVNNGAVTNEAIVQSQYEGMVVENSAISVFPSDEPAGPLVLRKFVTGHNNVDSDTRITTGDTINYLIVATNVGDTTLSNVTIVDMLPGASALVCNGSGLGAMIPPNEALTCQVSYVVTEQDGLVEEGTEFNVLTNVAYATADGPFAVAVQVDNQQVFPMTTAVSLSNTSIGYSATLLLITVVAIVLAQVTNYVTRREL